MGVRLSKSLCKVVGEVLQPLSHTGIDNLFRSAGAPGEPPSLALHSKAKEWLFRAGADPDVDSLAVLGTVIEEFMDVPPSEFAPEHEAWKANRARLERELEENGLRYFRFGRVLPQGESLQPGNLRTIPACQSGPTKPKEVEELLQVIIHGLRTAMHPLTRRRKGLQTLSFSSEYDVQDLLHALLRPWIKDIREEEPTPSCAGASTRMDFLLPKYGIVIETKLVRDSHHGKNLGKELMVDFEHYARHPECSTLWCVVYDPNLLISNAEGFRNDLQGKRSTPGGEIDVRVFVV